MRRVQFLMGVLLWVIMVGCQAPGRIPGTSARLAAQSATATLIPPTPSLTAGPSLAAPTATPPPTASATPTPLPTPTQTDTPTPSITPTRTATPTPSTTPTPCPVAALPGNACNLTLIGHDALGSRGSYGCLGVDGACAYVGSYVLPEVTIVDISDPTHPLPVGTIPIGPGAAPVEMRALTDLHLLVVVDMGQSPKLLTYNITDCAHPVLLGTFALPMHAHEFYVWRKGSQVVAYLTGFKEGPPDLLAVDLSDPARPHEVGRWVKSQEGVQGSLHSLSVSPDGKRAYLALWGGGFLVADIALPTIKVVRGADGAIHPLALPNAHSAVPLRDAGASGDPRLILVASEVFACPYAGLTVVDISDPGRPQAVSEFKLPEARCNALPAVDAVFTPHNPLVVGDLVFASWYAGGVQVLDLRDPLHPQRAGQFIPTAQDAPASGLWGNYRVQMFSYPILVDGLFYVVDGQSGFYVLRYDGPGAEAIAAVPRAEGNITINPLP